MLGCRSCGSVSKRLSLLILASSTTKTNPRQGNNACQDDYASYDASRNRTYCLPNEGSRARVQCLA